VTEQRSTPELKITDQTETSTVPITTEQPSRIPTRIPTSNSTEKQLTRQPESNKTKTFEILSAKNTAEVLNVTTPTVTEQRSTQEPKIADQTETSTVPITTEQPSTTKVVETSTKYKIVTMGNSETKSLCKDHPAFGEEEGASIGEEESMFQSCPRGYICVYKNGDTRLQYGTQCKQIF